MRLYKKLIQVVIISILCYLVWVIYSGFEEFISGMKRAVQEEAHRAHSVPTDPPDGTTVAVS